MTIKTFFKTCLVTAVLGSFVLAGTSCQKDETPAGEGNGTITGTVTNADGDPIDGVSVSASNSESTATTGADGTYTLSNVPVATLSVTFKKEGYQTASITVPASRFSNGTATVNATLTVAGAKITGTILDGANGDAPLEGATVTLNNGTSATTDADGTFTIENLTVRDYTLTVSAEGYIESNTAVAEADFNNEETTATVTVTLYKTVLLPGLTLSDLQNADIWYYNEYRGGKGVGQDWTTNYMSTLDFRGTWENQNEGCTLQVSDAEEDKNNPVNLDVFESFVFGKKEITNDNSMLSIYLRTHNADASAPAYFGVQVIDLTATEPTAVKIGENRTHGSDSYANYTFDLSEYEGKEVIVAIGIYRSLSGDGCKKQVAMSKISFAPAGKENKENDPVADQGTAVNGLDGWRLSQEMVRSTMVNSNTSFQGLVPSVFPLDNGDAAKDYAFGYNCFRGMTPPNVLVEWALMYINKDIENYRSQGIIIKTRSGAAKDTSTPESYVYAKFNIDSNHDNMSFYTRNFEDANETYFKVMAITEDGSAASLKPGETSTVDKYSFDETDQVIKFVHNRGEGNGELSDYGKFDFDLSSYSGQDIIIAIAVFKGESGENNNQEGEQKLVIREIDFN